MKLVAKKLFMRLLHSTALSSRSGAPPPLSPSQRHEDNVGGPIAEDRAAVDVMYPNRQFLAHFVVHMPLCLHVLFRVAGPLHSNGGGREPSLRVCFLGDARIPSRRRLPCKGEVGGGVPS